jgi:hypothetical protein
MGLNIDPCGLAQQSGLVLPDGVPDGAFASPV